MDTAQKLFNCEVLKMHVITEEKYQQKVKLDMLYSRGKQEMPLWSATLNSVRAPDSPRSWIVFAQYCIHYHARFVTKFRPWQVWSTLDRDCLVYLPPIKWSRSRRLKNRVLRLRLKVLRFRVVGCFIDPVFFNVLLVLDFVSCSQMAALIQTKHSKTKIEARSTPKLENEAL